jgi:hypothetical protein
MLQTLRAYDIMTIRRSTPNNDLPVFGSLVQNAVIAGDNHWPEVRIPSRVRIPSGFGLMGFSFFDATL